MIHFHYLKYTTCFCNISWIYF